MLLAPRRGRVSWQWDQRDREDDWGHCMHKDPHLVACILQLGSYFISKPLKRLKCAWPGYLGTTQEGQLAVMGPVNMRGSCWRTARLPKDRGEDQWPRKEQWLMGVHRPKRPQGRDPGWLPHREQEKNVTSRIMRSEDAKSCRALRNI